MSEMFHGCSSLTSLKLSNFETQNVINFQSMFNECSSLTSLNLSNFNTQNAVQFSGSKSLKYIDLSNFNTKNCGIKYIFDGCTSLTKENIKTKDKKILKKIDQCNLF